MRNATASTQKPTQPITKHSSILDEIKVNTNNPKRYSFDEHVSYFTRNFISCIEKFKLEKSTSKSQTEFDGCVKNYITYLADNIPDNTTTEQYAYLFTAMDKLLSCHYACTKELTDFFSELFHLWLEKSKTKQAEEPRYLVQSFFHICKIIRMRSCYEALSHERTIDDFFQKRIDALFNALLKKDDSGKITSNSQHIANTFLGLGYLAQQRKTYAISDSIISSLLEKLNGAEPNAQGIANTFLALGYLAQQGKTYAISDLIIPSLLEKLNGAEPNAQNIANTFLALGYLAQQGKTYAISDSIISSLLKKLNGAEPNTQEIANTLLGLGCLVQKKVIATLSNASLLQIQALKKSITVNKPDHCHLQQLIQTHHRFNQFLRIDVLDLEELKEIEGVLEKPEPNCLQKKAEKILLDSKIENSLETLLFGYFVDVYLPDKKIIIEFDGEHHYKSTEKQSTDLFRDELLRAAGYTIYRFKNSEVGGEKLKEKIGEVLSSHSVTTAPAVAPSPFKKSQSKTTEIASVATSPASLFNASSKQGSKTNEKKKKQKNDGWRVVKG